MGIFTQRIFLRLMLALAGMWGCVGVEVKGWILFNLNEIQNFYNIRKFQDTIINKASNAFPTFRIAIAGLSILFLYLPNQNVLSQNAIVGTGFSSGWGTACVNNANFNWLSPSAGGSNILSTVANGTGPQYFRVGLDYGGTIGQYNTLGGSPDVQVYPNTEYTLNSNCTNAGAMYFDVLSTSHNYIFKTKDLSATPSLKLIVFQLQGTVQTISTVSSPPGTKYPGETYSVSVTTTGTTVGQGFYLRYTTDNFSTSSIIPMTGSGSNYIATIPSSAHKANATIKYYIFSSGNGLTISHTNSDWYTINYSSTNTYVVASSSQTAQDGNWNQSATWLGGAIPPAGVDVVIAHNVTLNQDATVSSLTINSGATFTASDGSARTLTINSPTSATTLTNNGTWTNGTGGSTVLFTSDANITQTVGGTVAVGFNNVTLESASGATLMGINFGTASTISGTLQIKSGTYVNTNAPSYLPGSILQYNVNGTYERDVEWSQLSGNAYPYNVQISNNSYLNMNVHGPNTYRQIAGNLTIDQGSTFDMQDMDVSASDYGVTIMGNIINNGTVTFSSSKDHLKCANYINGTSTNATATTILSSQIGGDLEVTGDFTDFAIFIPNSRAVFFTGSTVNQTISKAGGQIFDYVIINKAAGNVVLANDVTINQMLFLIKGLVVTGSNTLIISSNVTGAIDGGSSASYINGKLRRGIANDANTYVFPIGTSATYAPVTFDFTAGTTAGYLEGYTNNGDHPSIGSSTLNFNKSVNRTWSFNVSSGLAIANYGATFNWLSADQDAGFSYTSANVGKYSASTWSYPTISIRTATSIQVTGVSGFGDFQVADGCVSPDVPTITATTNPICNGASTTLSIGSANLNDATDWKWYTVSCGGTSAGNGTSITVSPTTTTTYYVRGEGGCVAVGTCGQITVSVTPLPIAPISASVDRTNFCADDAGNIVLTYVGGSGTAINWYTGGCGSGSAIGTGQSFTIPSPAITTTYYARWETAPCTASTCASVTATVNAIPAITLGPDPTVCPGSTSANLTYSATTGSPNQYSIVWSPAALTALFSNVTNSALTASPIIITVPAAATPATYSGTLTVRNSATGCLSGNYSISVTNLDSQIPAALCKNITVNLNSSGTASIVAADVNNGSNDNCSAVSLSVSPNTFNCTNVSGVFTDLIISEYVEGSSSNKYVELYNGTASAIDLTNYKLRLYANGAASPTNDVILSGLLNSGATIVYKNSAAPVIAGAVDNAAVNFNGNDAVALYKISTSSFVDIFGRIGNDPGTAWTGSGYSTLDKTLRRKPTITKGVTTSPTGTGSTAFTTLTTEWDLFDVDDVSGLGSHSASVGNPVILTVTDAAGNTNTCVSNVTVLDVTQPTAVCQNISVSLNASGNATITADQIDNGSTDNCGIQSKTVSPSTFDCTNIGANTVTLTVTDLGGKTNTCTAIVTVQDNIAPVAKCKNIIVSLDAITGNATITASQVNNVSTDNCSSPILSVSPSSFNCTNVGANTVTLTVKDASNNSSTCTATVTVQDNTPPTAVCQNIIAQLDATGNAAITAAQINNGSNDICGIDTLVVSPYSFTCADITSTVVFNDLIISEYVKGSSNNKYIEIYNGTGSAVNLADYRLRCYNNGSASATGTNDIQLNGTLNNSSTIVYKNSASTVYTGASTTNTAVNFNGNDAIALYKISSSSFVDIFGCIGEDPGTAWTSGTFTTLDKTLVRKATVTSGVTANPSSGFPTLSTQWDQYNKDDVSNLGSHIISSGGVKQVSLTVTDVNGNFSTCNANVTLQDIIAPNIVCPETPSAICSSGSHTHTGTAWDATATDNCSIATIAYTLTGATTGTGLTTLAGKVFNVGITTVTWKATDVNGKFTSCSFDVTVNTLPVATASSNTPVCAGDTIHLSGGPDGMNSYSWLLPDGSIIGSYTNTVTQNFNSLDNNSDVWYDNTTIPDWYSQRTGTEHNYEAGDGASSTGDLYNFGTDGSNERALGSVGHERSETGSFAHGILYQNTSGQTLTSITVTYTLEQWRNSGAGAAQAVTVWYKTSASAIDSLTPNNPTGWTNVPGLTLNSPINTGAGTPLNGNSPANRVTATNVSIPGISLPNNQYIMIKWEDPDHPGSDHGLGIDDVTITYGTGDVQNLSIPDATTAMSGTYILTVIDGNGCSNTASTGVTINAKPTPSLIIHQ